METSWIICVWVTHSKIMQTIDAIAFLTALQATLQSEVTGKQAQIDALTTALGILNGTLATQLQALDDANTALASAGIATISPPISALPL